MTATIKFKQCEIIKDCSSNLFLCTVELTCHIWHNYPAPNPEYDCTITAIILPSFILVVFIILLSSSLYRSGVWDADSFKAFYMELTIHHIMRWGHIRQCICSCLLCNPQYSQNVLFLLGVSSLSPLTSLFFLWWYIRTNLLG